MHLITSSTLTKHQTRAENCDPANNISPIVASPSSPIINSAFLLSARDISTTTSSQPSTTSDFALASQSIPDLGFESQADDISTSCVASDYSMPSFSGTSNSTVGSFAIRNQSLIIVISSILSSIIIILICTLILLIFRYRNSRSRQCNFSQIPDRKNGSWCRKNSDAPEKPRASVSNTRVETRANHISKESSTFQTTMSPITLTKKPSHAILPMLSPSRTRLSDDDISAADLLIPKHSSDHTWERLSASRLNRIQQSYGISRMSSWNSQSIPVFDRDNSNDRTYIALCDVDEEVKSEFSQLRADCSSPETSIFDEISSIGTFRGLAPRPVTRS